jgi:anti-sigma factor RsiW
MSNHLREDRIQDYVDDLLCREERAEVERHLLDCAVCQAEVAALRDLVSDLHGVPGSIEPDRDLLAGINARIDAGAAAHTAAVHSVPRLRERTLWSLRVPLMAAAVVLIAMSAMATLLLSRSSASGVNGAGTAAGGPESGRSVVRAAQDNPPVAEQTSLDRRYASATRELEILLTAQEAQLAPETRRLVEENLRVIDHALAEARGALKSDPNNAALTDLMRSAYEKKIDLLRHATHLRGES